MKKLLSLAITAMMIVSMAASVFAVPAEPAAPDPDENTLSLWVEDVTASADDTTVDVYVNISHNEEGFEYCKFALVYPECLTFKKMDPAGTMSTSDLAKGVETTTINMPVRAIFDSLGLEASDYIDGAHKFVIAYFDAERYNDDDELIDCTENGRILKVTFEYDKSKNPGNEDLDIQIFSSVDDQTHCYNENSEWNDMDYNVVTYNGVIRFPAAEKPTLSVSSATIDKGDPTAKFDVSVSGNPGIFAAQIYFLYTKDASYSNYEIGTVFPSSAFPFNPADPKHPENISLCDKDVASSFTKYKVLESDLNAAGIDYTDKQMIVTQIENTSLKNITDNGVIFTVTLDTSALPAGVYDVSVCTGTGNTIDANYDDVILNLSQGTLTVIGACEHLNVEEVNRIEPTCTTPGSYDERCVDCGEIVSTGNVIAPGHDWQETEVTGNCGEIGVISYVCSRCGEAKTETGVVIEHNYVVVERVDATCSAPGYTKYGCTRCGNTYTVTETGTEPVAHTPAREEIPATCTEEGMYFIRCSVCGEFLDSGIIPAQGHRAVVDRAVSPTCTESGLTRGTHCSVCKEVLTAQEIIPALGHRPAERTIEATCTETGEIYQFCTVCGVKIGESEIIPAKGHTPSEVRTEPTCTEPGTIYQICSICSAVLTDTEMIPATGHTAVESREEPTCTEAGAVYQICSVCGETLSVEEIRPLGHDIVRTERPATCTENGMYFEKCSRCGKTVDAGVLVAPGHHFNGYRITVQPTENEPGIMEKVCSRCGEVVQIEIEYELNDVNGDGYVNARDLSLAKRYIAGTVEDDQIAFVNADINGDGKVNSRDLMLLKIAMVTNE